MKNWTQEFPNVRALTEKMTRAVHYQMADLGTRWIKDAEIAVDSDGPLDAELVLTPNVIRVGRACRMYYAG